MQTLIRDIQHAFRLFFRNRLFTTAAIVTLALAIGANTAVFSVVNAILFPLPPYEDSDRVVQITEERNRIDINNYDDWWEQADFLESAAGYKVKAWHFAGQGEPARIVGYSVSSSFLNVVRVQPILGRNFIKQEDVPGAACVALISEEMWRAVFQADPHVLGRFIRFDEQPCEIIGVMSAAFRFPGFPAAQPQFWTTLGYEEDHLTRTAGRRVATIGRLKPGISIAHAQERLNRIVASLQQPGGYKMKIARLNPFEFRYRRAGRNLSFFSAAVFFVLLIACANIANLLLARAVIRKREMAVRIALGASRSRLMRLLLTESILLCMLGGICGLLLTIWLRDSFNIWIGSFYPMAVNYWTGAYPNTMNVRVLIFTAAVVMITGMLTGLAPALQAWRTDLHSSLKEGGLTSSIHFRGRYLQHFFIVLQIALSLVLLSGSGLMIQSIQRLQRVEIGFDPNFLQMYVPLPSYKYTEPKQWINFCEQLLERSRQLPGVQKLAVTTDLPVEESYKAVSVRTEEQVNLLPEDEPLIHYSSITPDFLATIGGVLLTGRGFSERDHAGAPDVVLVNQAFAQHYWPGKNPTGKRIHLRFDPPVVAEVVGVVRDMKQYIDLPAEPHLYVPFHQQPFLWLTLVLKGDLNVTVLAPLLYRQVSSIDSVVPVFGPTMMDRIISDATAERRSTMFLLTIFAALAVCLAMVGIYSLMSYSTARQTHEIGIRMSLGAKKSDVIKMILGQASLLVVTGTVIGLFLSFVFNRMLESFLYGISRSDVLTYIVVVALIAAVALIASWLPALRAAKIDPVIALREE